MFYSYKTKQLIWFYAKDIVAEHNFYEEYVVQNHISISYVKDIIANEINALPTGLRLKILNASTEVLIKKLLLPDHCMRNFGMEYGYQIEIVKEEEAYEHNPRT